MKRIMNLAIAIALFAMMLSPAAGAQASSQAPDQSLGDYARKVHKETGVKAKPKVFDNDTIPKDDKLSVVGQQSADNGGAAPSIDDKSSADSKDAEKHAPAGDEQARKQEEWKSWQGKLSSQKEQVDLAARELDVLTREYQLRAAAMYGDAGNRIRNSAQWDKQDADYKQKIADKQKAIDDGKQKLEDMQEEARKAGVPASMRE